MFGISFVGYFSFSGRQQQSECNQCINAIDKIAYKIGDDGATQNSNLCDCYLLLNTGACDEFFDLIPDECSNFKNEDDDVCQVNDHLYDKCEHVEPGITA